LILIVKCFKNWTKTVELLRKRHWIAMVDILCDMKSVWYSVMDAISHLPWLSLIDAMDGWRLKVISFRFGASRMAGRIVMLSIHVSDVYELTHTVHSILMRDLPRICRSDIGSDNRLWFSQIYISVISRFDVIGIDRIVGLMNGDIRPDLNLSALKSCSMEIHRDFLHYIHGSIIFFDEIFE
jgi:hypothetical protein